MRAKINEKKTLYRHKYFDFGNSGLAEISASLIVVEYNAYAYRESERKGAGELDLYYSGRAAQFIRCLLIYVHAVQSNL